MNGVGHWQISWGSSIVNEVNLIWQSRGDVRVIESIVLLCKNSKPTSTPSIAKCLILAILKSHTSTFYRTLRFFSLLFVAWNLGSSAQWCTQVVVDVTGFPRAHAYVSESRTISSLFSMEAYLWCQWTTRLILTETKCRPWYKACTWPTKPIGDWFDFNRPTSGNSP